MGIQLTKSRTEPPRRREQLKRSPRTPPGPQTFVTSSHVAGRTQTKVARRTRKQQLVLSSAVVVVPGMEVGGLGAWAAGRQQRAGTLGRHLARRLVQIGATDVFSVPGDFNLTLLDHLIAEPELNLVGCCNELNAGYAADGYARSRGVGACVVTFTVGGLSVINAIAGANSENLPLVCIVGGPNSNDYGTNRILHHTIGLPDFSQELRCFQAVTCFQVNQHLRSLPSFSPKLDSREVRIIIVLEYWGNPKVLIDAGVMWICRRW